MFFASLLLKLPECVTAKLLCFIVWFFSEWRYSYGRHVIPRRRHARPTSRGSPSLSSSPCKWCCSLKDILTHSVTHTHTHRAAYARTGIYFLYRCVGTMHVSAFCTMMVHLHMGCCMTAMVLMVSKVVC